MNISEFHLLNITVEAALLMRMPAPGDHTKMINSESLLEHIKFDIPTSAKKSKLKQKMPTMASKHNVYMWFNTFEYVLKHHSLTFASILRTPPPPSPKPKSD